MCPGIEPDLTHPRHKEEIAQVGNTRTAEMRQAETEQRRMVVFIAGSDIVIIEIGIGTHLDTAERDLRTGVSIPETRGAHQRADILGEFFLRRVQVGMVHATRRRNKRHSAQHRERLSEHVCHRLSVWISIGFEYQSPRVQKFPGQQRPSIGDSRTAHSCRLLLLVFRANNPRNCPGIGIGQLPSPEFPGQRTEESHDIVTVLCAELPADLEAGHIVHRLRKASHAFRRGNTERSAPRCAVPGL